jgi:hypothetical protein
MGETKSCGRTGLVPFILRFLRFFAAVPIAGFRLMWRRLSSLRVGRLSTPEKHATGKSREPADKNVGATSIERFQ